MVDVSCADLPLQLPGSAPDVLDVPATQSIATEGSDSPKHSTPAPRRGAIPGPPPPAGRRLAKGVPPGPPRQRAGPVAKHGQSAAPMPLPLGMRLHVATRSATSVPAASAVEAIPLPKAVLADLFLAKVVPKPAQCPKRPGQQPLIFLDSGALGRLIDIEHARKVMQGVRRDGWPDAALLAAALREMRLDALGLAVVDVPQFEDATTLAGADRWLLDMWRLLGDGGVRRAALLRESAGLCARVEELRGNVAALVDEAAALATSSLRSWTQLIVDYASWINGLDKPAAGLGLKFRSLEALERFRSPDGTTLLDVIVAACACGPEPLAELLSLPEHCWRSHRAVRNPRRQGPEDMGFRLRELRRDAELYIGDDGSSTFLGDLISEALEEDGAADDGAKLRLRELRAEVDERRSELRSLVEDAAARIAVVRTGLEDDTSTDVDDEFFSPLRLFVWRIHQKLTEIREGAPRFAAIVARLNSEESFGIRRILDKPHSPVASSREASTHNERQQPGTNIFRDVVFRAAMTWFALCAPGRTAFRPIPVRRLFLSVLRGRSLRSLLLAPSSGALRSCGELSASRSLPHGWQASRKKAHPSQSVARCAAARVRVRPATEQRRPQRQLRTQIQNAKAYGGSKTVPDPPSGTKRIGLAMR